MPRRLAAGSARSWSLQSRLYLIAGVSVLLAWLGGGAAMFVAADDASERMRREKLFTLAQTVLGFAAHELEEIRADAAGAPPTVVHQETAATLPPRYSYQIWSEDGELLLRSVHAPDGRLAPPSFAGFGVVDVNGHRHALYAVRSTTSGMTVLVTDNDDEREFAAVFGAHFALIVALLLPPVLAGTWLLLRRTLVPLVRASQALEQNDPLHLSPLPPDGAPKELVSIIEAVNRLMRKVADALSQERQFTSLAAHELRTPLASLRVQAQVVARSRDAAEQRRELAALEANVDRCTRMFNQMLALASVDALRPENVHHERLLVRDLLAEVLTDFVLVAEQRGIDVICDLDDARAAVDRVLMQTLLRNLLSNAIQYTPAGGQVRIRAAQEPGRMCLVVEDSGPGIADDERERVFERFYRGREPRGPGVGLGLSIVAAIARAHGARIELTRSALGGLRVELSLPERADEVPTASAAAPAGLSLAASGSGPA